MRKENTSIRLKKIMAIRNLRQIDIVEMAQPYCKKYCVKMGKPDISQYVSGKVEPSQEKLVVLSMALHVSEAWLMGFDVPMENTTNKTTLPIMEYYNSLNETGKQEATKRVEELTHLSRYILNAAHADDYTNAPDELKQQEEDIMDDDNFGG